MSIFETTPSGYWLQEPHAPAGVVAELRELGLRRPVEPNDGLDESMPAESLRVILQVGCEMLAKRAGMGLGDYLTADLVNRGLLDYLRERQDLRKAAGLGPDMFRRGGRV